MSLFTRNRLVAAGLVLGFVAVLAAVGAASRSTDTAASPGAAVGTEGVPTVPWYWTMIVSPSDEDVILLGTSKGLYRSADGGTSWAPTGPKNVHATSLVQLDDAMVMGGVRLGPKASPNPIIRKGNGRVAPDGPAVVAVSTDDGKTWKELHPRGLPKTTIQALAIKGGDTSTLYALLNDGKLYSSTDEAASFKLVSPKLGIAPWALTYTDGRFVSGDMDSGSFVSGDAKKWQNTPFKDSSGNKMVMEYAVQPGNPKRILMSSDGIVMSSDGGKTWKIVLKSTTMFGPIAYVPSAADVAYAVGFDYSFWRSENGGKSWKQVSSPKST